MVICVTFVKSQSFYVGQSIRRGHETCSTGGFGAREIALEWWPEYRVDKLPAESNFLYIPRAEQPWHTRMSCM
jgi:hypothetical protein